MCKTNDPIGLPEDIFLLGPAVKTHDGINGLASHGAETTHGVSHG